jgi:hypothetical protein
MSQENVEVVRRAFAAWNAGDMDAFRELHDPDVILQTVQEWPEPGPHVGREAVMRFIEQLRDTWKPTRWNRPATSATPPTALPSGSSGGAWAMALSRVWSSRASLRFATAESTESSSFGVTPTPSKPPGCRGRRCGCAGVASRERIGVRDSEQRGE